MDKLATVFRAAQFYAHAAHNMTKGETFFSDHDYFGDLYGAYEEAYDGIIERMIGLSMKPDINKITMDAAKVMAEYDYFSTAKCFTVLLETEMEICALIDKLNKNASLGTQNFLQGLADDSEKRQYKIGQRIK